MPAGAVSPDPLQNFKNIIERDDYGHLCGGISVTYFDLLDAFGFKARVIQMLGEDYPSNPYDTHVTTEALVGGQWIALDATFNIAIKDHQGNYLNYDQAAQAYAASESLDYDTDGFSDTDRLDSYYLPYETFSSNFYSVISN